MLFFLFRFKGFKVPSNIDTAFGRFDDYVLDERVAKKELDKRSKAMKATEEVLIKMRTQTAELHLEIAVQIDPLADAKRFELLEMYEDFQVKVMKTDNAMFDTVLAVAKARKSRRRRVDLLAGLDKLNYNFLKKPAK